MAHDEYIPFTVSDGMLEVQGEKSSFDGNLRIDFVKVKVTINVFIKWHDSIAVWYL